MADSELHLEARRKVIETLCASDLGPGDRLPVRIFADLGISRGPIRKQLLKLAEDGVLGLIPDRGFHVRDLSSLQAAAGEEAGEEEALYAAIASDCIAGRLPQTIMLNELMRRYPSSKAAMNRVLGRIEREGWAEKRAGRGWSFVVQINTPECYEQVYAVRRAIEPAAILYERHVTDEASLRLCLDEQEAIVEGGYERLSPGEIFAMQSQFHERLMRMSCNMFFIQTFERLNSISRLATYRRQIDRNRVRVQSAQHLRIARALGSGDRHQAARMMNDHLGGQDRLDMKSYLFDG